MDRENQRLHAIVKGMVQGVGFRYFVLEITSGAEITGWVRNTMSGDVEVLAEGQKAALENLLTELQKGPRSAEVSNVDVEWSVATNEFNGFSVIPTA